MDFLASKLYGVNATIIIFVFVLCCLLGSKRDKKKRDQIRAETRLKKKI